MISLGLVLLKVWSKHQLYSNCLRGISTVDFWAPAHAQQVILSTEIRESALLTSDPDDTLGPPKSENHRLRMIASCLSQHTNFWTSKRIQAVDTDMHANSKT